MIIYSQTARVLICALSLKPNVFEGRDVIMRSGRYLIYIKVFWHATPYSLVYIYIYICTTDVYR